MDSLKLFAITFVNLFVEMAPFLLLGFLFAGMLHVWVPKSLYIPKLNKSNFKSVLYSALLGIPLPICSCGVIPTAVALHKEGASKGATVSFMVSTPATGVDSILATYSLLGLPFAILRPIAAFFTSLFGGVLTNALTKNEHKVALCKNELHNDCGNSHSEQKHKCCCHYNAKNMQTKNEHCNEKCQSATFYSKLKGTFEYGFLDLLPEISKWLLIGLLLGALIAAFVPNEIFVSLQKFPVLCMVTVLLISMPMYTCSTGSIPLALALMAKGISPGAALVLLMAGPATSIASMTVVGKAFGKKTLIAYVLSIGIGAFAFGLFVDKFMANIFIKPVAVLTSDISSESFSVFSYICAIALIVFIVYGFISQKLKHHKHC